MNGRIDVSRLHTALDAERQSRGLSWRQLAQAAGVSPSLLSRMGKGHRPDLESFAALVQWLRQPAEQFMRPASSQGDTGEEPAFEAQFAPLLRARSDLSEEDKEYLMQMVAATMKYLKSGR